jgi:signal transduction histidine kinase
VIRQAGTRRAPMSAAVDPANVAVDSARIPLEAVRLTLDAPSTTDRLAELQAAFEVFTGATSVLEQQYRALQSHVEALRAELEEKQRALTASIERQRCLETQALRHSRLAAMGEMAATLAHEVRNPLGAMELFAGMLAEEIADRPTARRLTAQIANSIADLNHLVTNILDYTRLPEPKRTAVDLDALIDEVLFASTAALGPGVTIERGGTAGASCTLDRGLVTQTLVNLIRNAGEAMAGTGTLRVAVEPADRWVRIIVADSGPGIPAGREEAIFAPFFTTKERGTGLGLAVARAAVAAHGGTLAIRPRPIADAHGAVFVLTLPQIAAPFEGDA